MTLTGKVLAGLSLISVLAFALGLKSALNARNVAADVADLESDEFKMTTAVMDANIHLIYINRALLRHINDDNVEKKKLQEEQIAESNEAITTRLKSVIDHPNISADERELLLEAKDQYKKMYEAAQILVALSNGGRNEAAREKASYLRAYTDRADQLLSEFVDRQRESFRNENNKVQEAARFDQILSSILVAMSVLASIVVAFVVRRPLKRFERALEDLKASSKEVSGAAKSIAEASQSQASSSAEQASAIEETSASLAEMTGMVENNVKNSERAADVAGQMLGIADEGGRSMESVASQMGEILESNKKIEELVKVIEEIGEKTSVIDEIVFQTKLLSFNASVEAERAGDHGRGFAVVAQEVGNLAQMSGKAALEIASIVKNSIKEAQAISRDNKERVEKGHQLVLNTKGLLQEVRLKSDVVAKSSEQIVQASREQSAGISQINAAIAQLNQSVQQSTASTEQSAGASEQLRAQSAQMDSLVETLRADLLGRGASQSIESRTEENRPIEKAEKKKPVKKAVDPIPLRDGLMATNANSEAKAVLKAAAGSDTEEWERL